MTITPTDTFQRRSRFARTAMKPVPPTKRAVERARATLDQQYNDEIVRQTSRYTRADGTLDLDAMPRLMRAHLSGKERVMRLALKAVDHAVFMGEYHGGTRERRRHLAVLRDDQQRQYASDHQWLRTPRRRRRPPNDWLLETMGLTEIEYWQYVSGQLQARQRVIDALDALLSDEVTP